MGLLLVAVTMMAVAHASGWTCNKCTSKCSKGALECPECPTHGPTYGPTGKRRRTVLCPGCSFQNVVALDTTSPSIRCGSATCTVDIKLSKFDPSLPVESEADKIGGDAS